MREDEVLFATKEWLRQRSWKVIAYRPPGGHGGLFFADPQRQGERGSQATVIPDILAVKDNYIMLVESKSRYSGRDRAKLDALLNDATRREWLIAAIATRCREQHIEVDVQQMIVLKALAYAQGVTTPSDFITFKVSPSGEVVVYIGDELPHKIHTLF